MERFFTSNFPWNRKPRLRACIDVKHPPLSIFLALAFLFFCFGCSDETVSLPSGETYHPFPLQSPPALSARDLNLVDPKTFVKVEAGDFTMGSPPEERGRNNTETSHRVRITRPYFISKFEVTVKQWNEIFTGAAKKEIEFFVPRECVELLGWLAQKGKPGDPFSEIESAEKNSKGEALLNTAQVGKIIGLLGNLKPQQLRGSSWPPQEASRRVDLLRSSWLDNVNLPVTDVSYGQAQSFCYAKTSEAHKIGALPKGLIYRLPTEAEWEYACRAGNPGVCGLDEGNELSGMNANINGGSRGNVIGKNALLINRQKLMPIFPEKPKLKPNAWGIHDMHGNVMEWCYDFFGEYPDEELSIDPIGPIRGAKRVLRGGSFLRPAQSARSAARESLEPSWRGSEIGFRVVLGYPLR